jgi:hypothetical protein
MITELHSEKLKKKYGPIHLEIIKQSELNRLSVLKDNSNCVRTIAIAEFSLQAYSTELNRVHLQIYNGGFIGDTIIKNRMTMVKKINCRFRLNTPELMLSAQPYTIGQYTTIFVITSQAKEYYCDLCEIFYPEFESNEEYNYLHNEAYQVRVVKLLTTHDIKFTNLTLLH